MIGAALSGISEEVAALEWSWGERTVEERALDERRPWWPAGSIVATEAAFGADEIVVARTGDRLTVHAVGESAVHELTGLLGPPNA